LECAGLLSLEAMPLNHDLQKASLLKRISAYSFDLILLVCLVIALAAGLSGLLGYADYSQRMDQAYEEYGQQYGVDVSISWEDYEKLTEAEKARYEEALEAINADESVMRDYSMMVNLTLIIATVSILLGYMALELAVPLLFGNGQTLGKKIFGIALMRADGVKITPFMLFVRTVLGKFTLETMIPVLVIIMLLFQMVGLGGTALLALLVVAQIACIIITKTNSAIHDLLACTVAVDMASQHIFNSPEELLEYTKKLHAEQASRADY
jgi:uncharacterized RDD family membrane protein YckC